MKPSDEDLDSLLKTWTVPQSPGSLEGRMRHAYRSRTRERAWSWLLYGKLRIPVPVLALALVLLAALSVLAWRRTETATSQDHTVRNGNPGGYQFVTELKPRIVRRNHVNEN
jgi:hypothetical protein